MTTFILDIAIMVSLGVVVYLVTRSLPKIDDADLKVDESKTNGVILYLEQVDEKVRIATEKALRRVRVGILKLDNKVSKKLDSYKSQKEEQKSSLFDAEEEEEKNEW